jgi:hypothetical protein
MDDVFKIIKGKLKEVDPENTWHEYLLGKTLSLCSSVAEGCWNLVGIDGEVQCEDFFKWFWDKEQPAEYESFEEMLDSMINGYDSFGFEADEIEVIEFLIGYDFEKMETVKP